jgi:GT2 family glycosyltransferase
MIPTYNAPRHLLEKCLQSVLGQDPGPDVMQIEVVDDCSPEGSPEELVHRIGKNRVALYKSPRNLGMAGCYNRMIERAEGQWVHILDQDDLVLPEFYARLRSGIENRDDVGAAFCRFAYVDGDGHWLGLGDLERRTPGVIADFYPRLAAQQRIQIASLVVRKTIYQQVGPYRKDFVYALDWEMYLRICLMSHFWYEPSILACYRLHGASTTARLARRAIEVRELTTFLDGAEAQFPKINGRSPFGQARVWYSLRALETANEFRSQGEITAAVEHLRAAWRLQPSIALVRGTFRFLLSLLKQQTKRIGVQTVTGS